MTLARFGLVLATVSTILLPSAATAQADSAGASRVTPAGDARDTLFLRARRLVAGGNGAAGRALVDSALAATTAGTTEYATALYWRGALASTAADAERDYRRIIVEYPFSPHSGDALLALAQLEMARGDRDPAIDHLQRFLLQRPNDPERVRAGIWLGRMLLEQNRLVKGCTVLLRTRASLGDTAVETRNQVDYYAARCAGVDTTPPAPRPDSSRRQVAPRRDSARSAAAPRPSPNRDTVASKPRPRHDSAGGDSARGGSARARSSVPNAGEASTPGRYTVQVAAYDTRQSAEQLVTRLTARGIIARVVASKTPPYRVRIGRYATDAAATAAARDLKEKGIVGFVTTTDNESPPAPVRP